MGMHDITGRSTIRRLAVIALAATATITPLMRAGAPEPTTMPAKVEAAPQPPEVIAIEAPPMRAADVLAQVTAATKPAELRRVGAGNWTITDTPAATSAAEPLRPDAKSPTFETLNDRKPVMAGEIDRALASEWIVATLPESNQFPMWGQPVIADAGSTLVLGCSSEYQFVLVLSGKAKRGTLSADAGHVVFWPAGAGAKPRVMEYSGRDFQRSMRDSGRADLAAKLDEFTSSQDTRRWWGLVKPMNVNIGAPVRVAVDQARKSYLMQPEAIRVRHDSKNTEDIPRATASAMFNRLRSGESKEVAQLLSPELFLEPAKRNELARAREAVATNIVGQPWTKQIDEASFRGTSDPYKYMFSSGKRVFVMTLKPFDQMVYVTSIRPEVVQ